MSCKSRIIKNIVNDCHSLITGGIQQDFVYLVNRADVSATMNADNDVIIDDLVISTDIDAAPVYKLVGINQNIVVGGDRVVGTDMPDLFTHYLSFKGFEWDSASIENLDNMGDLVAFVVRKSNFMVDGKIEVYGLQGGLNVSSDTFRSNTDNMTRSIELTSTEGSQEAHSVYTYMQATTKPEGGEEPEPITSDSDKVAAGLAYLDSLIAE